MNEEIQARVRAIKQSFRLKMDGVASRSMREKGLDYKLNWGVSIPDLQLMAQSYGKDHDLAVALWEEPVRECKILATMLMPPRSMSREEADAWTGQMATPEIAGMAVFNLFRHLSYAWPMAFEWIASDDEMRQLCGYQTLARLFMKGQSPNGGDTQAFIDRVLAALQGSSLSVRHAALNSLRHFASLGEEYAQISESALKTLNLEFF